MMQRGTFGKTKGQVKGEKVKWEWWKVIKRKVESEKATTDFRFAILDPQFVT